MAFRTNPFLEKYEKKHPKTFLVISLIISLLVISAGLWLFFNSIGDNLVSIFMIIMGVLGLACTVFLKIYNK